mmetsp:Transcript_47349/g.137968  ORF Transcript_47349/g.137968 Transcript_47349/m.137968 type:complete len:211 (-) Transcript_47349:3783-4415(-)
MRSARSSIVGVPRALKAFSAVRSKDRFLDASCSRRAAKRSPMGNKVCFASSCAEASAPVQARFKVSTSARVFASSASSLPLRMRRASSICITSVRSAARARLISSTSSMSSPGRDRRAYLMLSTASCTRMNLVSAASSEMSSASFIATYSASSSSVAWNTLWSTASRRFKPSSMSASGAPARRAWISADLSSAAKTFSLPNMSVKTLTLC